jgi:ABC-type sugar transport system ATPase subunit
MQTREELKRIHAELKATFIYVTHDQDDASAMGDEVVVMAAGRIHQADKPSDVYRHPADRFVASFLGRLPMNFLTGVVGDRAGLVAVRGDDGAEVDLGPRADGFRAPDGRVLIGIRPESVVASRADAATAGVLGTVTLTEVVPPDSYVTAALGGWSVRARVVDGDELEPGDTVRLRFAQRSLHFFDPESEQRLETASTSEPASAVELVEEAS